VSDITVKMHRGSVMRKKGARSLTDLVKMADEINRHRWSSSAGAHNEKMLRF
jgi:DNA-binding NarL/FixJ family response regulator